MKKTPLITALFVSLGLLLATSSFAVPSLHKKASKSDKYDYANYFKSSTELDKKYLAAVRLKVKQSNNFVTAMTQNQIHPLRRRLAAERKSTHGYQQTKSQLNTAVNHFKLGQTLLDRYNKAHAEYKPIHVEYKKNLKDYIYRGNRYWSHWKNCNEGEGCRNSDRFRPAAAKAYKTLNKTVKHMEKFIRANPTTKMRIMVYSKMYSGKASSKPSR